jgi:predicted transcriptional regulator
MLCMAKKAEKSDRTTPITMRISSKLLAELDELSNPYDIPRTQLIHRAIEEYVERRKGQKPADDEQPRPRR